MSRHDWRWACDVRGELVGMGFVGCLLVACGVGIAPVLGVILGVTVFIVWCRVVITWALD